MVKTMSVVFLILLNFVLSVNLRYEKTNYNQNTEIVEKYTRKKFLNECNESLCNGACYEDLCYCKEGYIDISEIINDGTICSYQQKKQIIAFYLEFLLPGAGHLYSNRIISGVLKLILYGMIIFILYYNNTKEGFKFYLKSILFVTFGLIHIMDDLAFLLNIYTDGYGIPLISMHS